MSKLEQISMDTVRALPAKERKKVLKLYHESIKRQRITDRKIHKNILTKVWKTKNPEKYKILSKRNKKAAKQRELDSRTMFSHFTPYNDNGFIRSRFRIFYHKDVDEVVIEEIINIRSHCKFKTI